MSFNANERVKAMAAYIEKVAMDKVAEEGKKNDEKINEAKEKKIGEGQALIREEVQKKTKKLDTTIAIAKSTAINKGRLSKIRARQDVLSKIHEEASNALKKEASGKPFVTKLITQGLLMLLEKEVKVRCKACDTGMVQGCLEEAAAQYADLIKKETGADKQCKLEMESKNLPDSCLGGIMLTCQGGSITIDNTVDSRLDLVMEQAKPKIRSLLFKNE